MRKDSEVLKKTQEWWDVFYLRIARQYAEGSKDPSLKVGAIITVRNRIRAAGYNNFPSGMIDNPETYHDRKKKLEYINHAETSALEDFDSLYKGCLYVYPICPCVKCSETIVESGQIHRVVSTDYTINRWKKELDAGEEILKSANIELIKIKTSTFLYL